MKWKVLTSEYLIKAPWAVLRRDKCEMPNGHVVPEYYVLEYPNWVNIVALTKDNQVILVKQYRHGAGIESLEIPGGVIDEGEDAETAARREMLEETGYTFDQMEKIVELYPNPATSTNITTTFVARGGVKIREQALDDQEEIEVFLVSIDETKKLLKENKIPQALHAAALFYALY
ncbi:NUDIX hydrolase [Olivibacter sp. SDN3]|uniref:NUDIX hydrolase n=1 Tax=Olivibacter sp. SDN3 TaxID=2764720 RepID=UPI001651550F|nr:NUDIX hydrolase [Olivibacter sp. SDN3]QNL52103.1 NUDIX hydrolase [Olivibacter sp. SDN3]